VCGRRAVRTPRRCRSTHLSRATVLIRALFRTRDATIDTSLVAPETANADDYTLETVDASHFVSTSDRTWCARS